jgi:hypothetical protein
MSEIINKEELTVPVKDFYGVCKILENKYNSISIPLFSKNYYPINGFGILPIERKQALLFTGNLKGVEEFLKEEGIEERLN